MLISIQFLPIATGETLINVINKSDYGHKKIN